MKTFTLAGAALRDRPGRWDITVRDGIVAAIGPAIPRPRTGEQVFELDGRLVLDGLVDLHVHLDKAYQLDLPGQDAGGPGGIADALRAAAMARPGLTAAAIERGARRVLDTLVSGGTVGARAHVEIGPQPDQDLVRLHLDLAAEYPELFLQLTAFAQYGTSCDSGIVRRMERALASGCTVVGGCPYADQDPIAHLDQVIALAVGTGLPLDLHLDLSDNASDLMLHEVIPRVEQAGLQGRVVVGHLTTMTALPPDRVRELAAAVAGAGITVVSLPATDIYLSGRGQPVAPTRGVTRLAEFAQAGATVALASNNYENAFTPVTMPSLTHAAWIACLTNYLGSAPQQLMLLDAITRAPRSVLGPDVPGLAVGSRVGAAVFDVAAPVDIVRSAARPVARVTARDGLVGCAGFGPPPRPAIAGAGPEIPEMRNGR